MASTDAQFKQDLERLITGIRAGAHRSDPDIRQSRSDSTTLWSLMLFGGLPHRSCGRARWASRSVARSAFPTGGPLRLR